MNHGKRTSRWRLRRLSGGAVLVLALAGLLALAGCQKTQRRTVGQDALAQTLAMVNNEPITYEEFQNAYQLFLTKWDRFIGNNQQRKQELKELLLQRLIDRKLLDQEARRRGIRVDDAELNARVLALLSAPNESGEEVGPSLPEDQLAEFSKALRRRMIHEKLIRQEVINKIRVTPAEMHNYYEKHKTAFHLPERVRARHIAVGSRALFNKVVHLLRRHTDFVKLVHKYSITPDRMEDGDLGYVERGVLPPEFDAAIFKMKVGSVGPERDPVQTQMGYHLFRVEGRKPESQLDYRQAIPEIRALLVQQKETAAYRHWLKQLRDRSTITIEYSMLNTE